MPDRVDTEVEGSELADSTLHVLSRRAVFWILFSVALAVRGLLFLQLSDSPFFAQPLGDGQGYDVWAGELLSEGWLWKEGLVFYQAPLYPYFLAMVYAVVGHNVLAVLVLQCILGALAAGLLAGAADRFFGRSAGICAGLLSALYAPGMYFDVLIQKASLAYFMVSLLLFVMALYRERPHSRTALGCGAALGTLCLLRENSLFFIPFLLMWLVALPAVGERRARAPAILLAGLLLVLLPVGLRNYLVGGEFHITTSQLGPNFYIGNHANARGLYGALVEGHGSWTYERSDATRLAVEASGRDLTPAEVSDYWLGRALDEIKANPERWLGLMVYKSKLLINQREVEDSDSIYAYADDSSLLRNLIPVFGFALIFTLAFVGTSLGGRAIFRHWILYAYIAGFGATVVIFAIMDRYRHPMAPGLILIAGYGVASLIDLIRDPAREQRVRSLGIAVFIGALALYLATLDLGLPIDPAKSGAYFNLAVNTTRYDHEAALPFVEKAVQLNPKNYRALAELGRHDMLWGDPESARKNLRAALKISPGYKVARSMLDNLGPQPGDRLRP